MSAAPVTCPHCGGPLRLVPDVLDSEAGDRAGADAQYAGARTQHRSLRPPPWAPPCRESTGPFGPFGPLWRRFGAT